MNKYLVTGGAGFIGANICHELVRQGHQVRIFDNFCTGKRSNLADIFSKVEIIEGDLSYLPAVKDAMKGINYVFHQGAIPSVPESVKNPIASHNANITGTLNILTASKEAGIKRVIYASSSSVYGDTKIIPTKESAKTEPISFYGLTKLAGEYYCRFFHRFYGLETVILRYFNVYGKYQDFESENTGVIPKIIRRLLQGRLPIIYGDGWQNRDFVSVDDVVQANLLAVNHPDVAGMTFNIASGKRITINTLVSKIAELMKKDDNAVYIDSQSGDVRDSHADISQAREKLGYNPEVSIEEGLKKLIEAQ